MLMKHFLYIILTSLTFSAGYSQSKLKYETIFFEDNSIETPLAKISVMNVISEADLIKGKIKVANYTDKALVIKPEECSYLAPAGEVFSKDRWMIIAPHQQETKTIDVKGDNLKTEQTTFKVGGFYSCNQVEITKAPDMQLPPQKELTIGNFKLELDGFDQDGKEIMIRYKIRYMGDKVGLLNPSLVLVKSPTGNEFKNQKEKDRIFAFAKKEDYLVGFTYMSDSKKENILMWKDAFGEGIPEKTVAVSIDLKMDLPKTKDKN
jgi:hypothetical protein